MIRMARAVAVGVAAALALTVSACSSSKSNPLSGSGGGSGTVTIGSANFPENILLGEIYAEALEKHGVKVTRKFNIGSREVLYGQIQSGALTILPEYNGGLLDYLDKSATANTTDAVDTELKSKLPSSLEVLDPAAAEDKDAMTVTAATAAQYHLTSIADLQPIAGQITLGSAPEFKTRPQGLPGLRRVYGLNIPDNHFKPLDNSGPETISALKHGDIQVGDIYSTDPSVKTNNFVVLTDPKNLFGAQNVIPLVYKSGVNSTIVDALDAVSAKLDTNSLADLVKQVVTDKKDVDAVAKSWLTSNGLA